MNKASPAPRRSPRAASPQPGKTQPGNTGPSKTGPSKARTKIAPGLRAHETGGAVNKHWRTYFLAALVETSNVTASAEKAGISPSRAYKVRREDPGFAVQWRVALREGYENLEMEVLGYLRCPDLGHKIDVTNAIRLLSQHRQSVAQDRALEDNRSEGEVLDSIDAMIDDMRERAAANAAFLTKANASDNADAQ